MKLILTIIIFSVSISVYAEDRLTKKISSLSSENHILIEKKHLLKKQIMEEVNQDIIERASSEFKQSVIVYDSNVQKMLKSVLQQEQQIYQNCQFKVSLENCLVYSLNKMPLRSKEIISEINNTLHAASNRIVIEKIMKLSRLESKLFENQRNIQEMQLARSSEMSQEEAIQILCRLRRMNCSGEQAMQQRPQNGLAIEMEAWAVFDYK